jgi:hypothetical protein
LCLYRFKKSHIIRNSLVAESRVIKEVLGQNSQASVNSNARNLSPAYSCSATSSSSPSPASGRKSIWDRHRESVDQFNSSRRDCGSKTANGIIMIEEYNSLPLEELTKDPLLYWHEKMQQGTNYKVLAVSTCTFIILEFIFMLEFSLVPGVLTKFIPTVRKFLCIPATSVPSEQLFSKAGERISARRNRLDGKNVNMLLFLN